MKTGDLGVHSEIFYSNIKIQSLGTLKIKLK